MTTTLTSTATSGRHGTALGWMERVAIIASSCARSLARLTLRGMRRTRNHVAQEYDIGRWSDVLRSNAWQSQTDLRRYLIEDRIRARSGQLIAYVNGVPTRVSVERYYDYRIDAFAQWLGQYVEPNSEIVELGCGYGYNLLSLAVTWPAAKLAGFDISENAVLALRNIGTHFRLSDRLQTDVLDVTNGAHPNFPKIAGRNVLTFFCIEQIPYEVSKVVANILAQKPKRVIHAEPSTGLLKWWRPRDLSNFLYLRSVDYQNDLYSVLQRLEREGRVRIVATNRMPFAPSLQNSGQLIVWEPTN